MLKVAPNVGHNVKNIFIRSWKLSNAAKYLDGWIPKTSKFVHKIFRRYFFPKNSKSKDEANTGCNRNTRNKFNHELLASCRTRKKYLKNSVKKYIDI
jgi:hypothetical protein